MPLAHRDETGRTAFADTTLGKIIIGLAIAAGSALLSHAVTRIFVEASPPVASIAPTEIEAAAGETVEFSSAGSFDPEGGPLVHSWTIGGVMPEKSSVAQCIADGEIFKCRFVAPGTFAVQVSVESKSNLTAAAAASTTVALPGGYLTLVLLNENFDAYRELLYAIDWVALQALVAKPIVLFDPDAKAPVYAASIDRTGAAGGSVESWQGAMMGSKIMLPPMPGEARRAFTDAFEMLGASVLQMASEEVIPALESGLADSAVISLSRPSDLLDIVERF